MPVERLDVANCKHNWFGLQLSTSVLYAEIDVASRTFVRTNPIFAKIRKSLKIVKQKGANHQRNKKAPRRGDRGFSFVSELAPRVRGTCATAQVQNEY